MPKRNQIYFVHVETFNAYAIDYNKELQPENLNGVGTLDARFERIREAFAIPSFIGKAFIVCPALYKRHYILIIGALRVERGQHSLKTYVYDSLSGRETEQRRSQAIRYFKLMMAKAFMMHQEEVVLKDVHTTQVS